MPAPLPSTSAQTPPPPAVPAWTSLRFFAALWIVLYHFGQSLPALSFLTPWTTRAGAPVSFFFFLSGFVLAYTYRSRPVTFTRFLRARLARLFPLYLIAMLAVFFLTCPFLELDRISALSWLTRLQVNALCIQTWIPDYALSMNVQSWAVSVEMSLYLVFPFLAPWIFRASSKSRAIAFVVLFASASAGLFCIRWLWDPWFYSDVSKLRFVHHLLLYHPLIYLPLFLLGMLSAPAPSSARPSATVSLLLSLLSLALILAITFHMPSWLSYAVHTGLLAPLFALLLRSLVHPANPLARLLSAPFLVALGAASYAMYIFQMPTALLCGKWFPAFSQSAWGFGAFLFALVLLSLVLSRYVEAPLRKWLLRPRAKKQ